MQFSTPSSLGNRWLAALVLFYWGALFVATHIPVDQPTNSLGGGDKAWHFGAYLVLAYLLGLWQIGFRGPFFWSQGIKILVILALYGAADELLQIPVGRHCDPWDWMADMAGTCTALVAFQVTRSVVIR